MAFTDVASAADIKPDASFAAQVGKTKILLTRVGGGVHAIKNKCPHLNLAMTRGKVVGAVVICPWHGSTFDMCTGKNLDWIASVAGMKVPQWSRAVIAFGRQPTAIRTFATSDVVGAKRRARLRPLVSKEDTRTPVRRVMIWRGDP